MTPTGNRKPKFRAGQKVRIDCEAVLIEPWDKYKYIASVVVRGLEFDVWKDSVHKARRAG